MINTDQSSLLEHKDKKESCNKCAAQELRGPHLQNKNRVNELGDYRQLEQLCGPDSNSVMINTNTNSLPDNNSLSGNDSPVGQHQNGILKYLPSVFEDMPYVENGILTFRDQAHFDEYYWFLEKKADRNLNRNEQSNFFDNVEKSIGFTSLRRTSDEAFEQQAIIGWARAEDIPDRHFIHSSVFKSFLNPKEQVRIGENVTRFVNGNIALTTSFRNTDLLSLIAQLPYDTTDEHVKQLRNEYPNAIFVEDWGSKVYESSVVDNKSGNRPSAKTREDSTNTNLFISQNTQIIRNGGIYPVGFGSESPFDKVDRFTISEGDKINIDFLGGQTTQNVRSIRIDPVKLGTGGLFDTVDRATVISGHWNGAAKGERKWFFDDKIKVKQIEQCSTPLRVEITDINLKFKVGWGSSNTRMFYEIYWEPGQLPWVEFADNGIDYIRHTYSSKGEKKIVIKGYEVGTYTSGAAPVAEHTLYIAVGCYIGESRDSAWHYGIRADTYRMVKGKHWVHQWRTWGGGGAPKSQIGAISEAYHWERNASNKWAYRPYRNGYMRLEIWVTKYDTGNCEFSSYYNVNKLNYLSDVLDSSETSSGFLGWLGITSRHTLYTWDDPHLPPTELTFLTEAGRC